VPLVVTHELGGLDMEKSTIAGGLVSAVVLTLLAACGSGSSGDGGAGGSASAADIAYAKDQVASYTQVPEFIPPGDPIDARGVMAGRSVTVLPYSSAIPFDQGMVAGMQEAAEQIGFDLDVYTNQGDPSQWNQGAQLAISNGSASLDLLTIDPNVLGPQIEAAGEAGVDVVSSHVFDPSQSVPDGVSAAVRFQYVDVGRLLADWTIADSSGKANVLIVGADDSLSTKPLVSGIESELDDRCGDACEHNYLSVPTSDWATKTQSEIQAALTRDPDIDYILPIYDGMAQYAVTALDITQRSDSVRIATFNGSTNVLDLVRQGKVAMDIGEPLGWVGKLIIDAHVRLAAGQEISDESSIPVRIFTADNVEEAGVPAQVSTGYGDAEQTGFDSLWQLAQ
jgi:ribose transport system substrate-binding protein